MSCGARHWFAYYGFPGTSSPVCRRCGAPNPRYRSWDDPNFRVDVGGVIRSVPATSPEAAKGGGEA